MMAASKISAAQSPVIEHERLLVVCVRRLARAITDGARGVSDAFAIETARYLTDAVRRLRSN